MSSDMAPAQAVAVADWAGERGRKWVEHLPATEAMLAPINEPLLAALDLAGARRVADIGCGGGRTSCAVAALLPADAQVHGIDVSPDVIAAARSAARAAGFRVHGADPQHRPAAFEGRAVQADAGAVLAFRCEDAARAAAPEIPYDLLTSRFGVMFFDDPPAAFTNLARMLRPGGRFAFAVWGPLGENPWMGTLRRVVAEEVDLPPPPPDFPGPFRYAHVERFVELLATAGFCDVSSDLWRGEVELGGGLPAEEAAAFCLRTFSIGDLLGDDPERLERVGRRLTALLRQHEDDGVVRMPAAVHLVTGGR